VGLAFDSAGSLYVANFNDETIEKFTSEGVGSTFATTGPLPQGLAFDSAGKLYVANSNNGTVEEFTSQGIGSVFANIDTP
jgi:DNA-binding beta-propeller fold protein YncE